MKISTYCFISAIIFLIAAIVAAFTGKEDLQTTFIVAMFVSSFIGGLASSKL